MLGCLPRHSTSFGFTVTMWYPLLRGCRLVTSPGQLDTRALIDTIREEEVTVLLGAPTFLRPFLKKASSGRRRVRSDLVVHRCRKLPEGLRYWFARGAPHRGPARGLRLTRGLTGFKPEPPAPTPVGDGEQPTSRWETGPAQWAAYCREWQQRVVDPESGREVAPRRDGNPLLSRGPNIFLRVIWVMRRPAPPCARAGSSPGTWPRIDVDGFVSIEGRQPVSSKIGGEMVPHGAVELANLRRLGGRIQARFDHWWWPGFRMRPRARPWSSSRHSKSPERNFARGCPRGRNFRTCGFPEVRRVPAIPVPGKRQAGPGRVQTDRPGG